MTAAAETALASGLLGARGRAAAAALGLSGPGTGTGVNISVSRISIPSF